MGGGTGKKLTRLETFGIGPKSLSPIGTTVSLIKGPPKPDEVEPPKMPTEIEEVQRRARSRIRERASSLSRTNLTGPSGLTTPASTAPKTLLGG